jgi:protein-L-isoaspartate(D-aspartate) O-methyltransferase
MLAMRRLLTGDAASIPDLVSPQWRLAFTHAGASLAQLAATGALTRGLRAVLAHLFIFHANCARIPGSRQAQLATVATRTVFGPPTDNTHADGHVHPTVTHPVRSVK